MVTTWHGMALISMLHSKNGPSEYYILNWYERLSNSCILKISRIITLIPYFTSFLNLEGRINILLSKYYTLYSV